MFHIGLKQANFNVSSKQKSCAGNSHTIQPPLICKGYQDKVSFKKIDGPSEATMAYLQIVKNRELDSLNSLDLNKMMDICKGIPVFEGWSAVDLLYATNNIEAIMLSRGCYKQCSHCGADALPKIKFMKWENFTELVDGIAILKERLGFNPFTISNQDFITPFHDSDSVDYRQMDDKKQMRTIFDAAKYFYDKTGSNFVITTAGWANENKTVQAAMEKIVENPRIIHKIVLSINPFHTLMTKSLEAETKGEQEKAQFYRERYVDMMANVVSTLSPLLEFDKLQLNVLYENSSDKLSYWAVKSLYEDICAKVKDKAPDSLFSKGKTSMSSLVRSGIMTLSEIECDGKAYELKGYKRGKLTKVTSQNLLDAFKYINIDGKILAAPPETRLAADFMVLPKGLKFSNPPVGYEEYTYPSLGQSDLRYSGPSHCYI